ncbi:MAG: cysteine desulfurase family protein [Candidatus Paceibacterota bacterium]|nr:MAG: cysteine desulfurase family protein [Candidatus Paceibacterota bacterium]
MRMIYADYAAAAPTFQSVRVCMGEALELSGNPSAPHVFGRSLRKAIEGVRRRVAQFAHARPEHVIFTSSGSESNALALRGAVAWKPGDVLITSAIEHASLAATATELSALGVEVRTLSVNAGGRISLSELESLFNARVRMVSVMHANNETGVIQPIEDMCRIVAERAQTLGIRRPLVHTDACQSAPWNMLARTSVCDLVSFNAAKVHGPLGVGVLVARTTIPSPLIHGGGQEWGVRGGSENVSGVAGLGAALEELGHDDVRGDAIALLRDAVWTQVHDADPSIIRVGQEPFLPGHLCLIAPGAPGEDTMLAMEDRGVCVGVGAACQSGKGTQSHVLAAMGIHPNLVTSAVRITIGRGIAQEDAPRIAEAYLASIAEVRSRYQSVSVSSVAY